MRFILAVLALGLLWNTGHVSAHTSHPSAGRTDSAVLTDDPGKESVQRNLAPETTLRTDQSSPDFQLHISEVLTEHTHNRLVHFPVALSIFALILAVWSKRNPAILPAVQLLVISAAIIALAAVFTGNGQSDVFAGDPKKWVVDIHRLLGIVSAILLWVWTVFLLWKPLRRFYLIIAILTVLCIIATGFYGGVISHG